MAPLRFTGIRAEQYDELKHIRRSITAEAYKLSVQDLQRRETRARALVERRNAVLIQQAQAQIDALNAYIQRQREQEAQRREERRKAIQAKAQPLQNVSFSATFWVREKPEVKGNAITRGIVQAMARMAGQRQRDDRPYRAVRRQISERTTTPEQFIRNYIVTEYERLFHESNLEVKYGDYINDVFTITNVDYNTIRADDVTNVDIMTIEPKPKDKRTVKMRSMTALALDGSTIQTWDTGKGTCVPDFLIWRYSELKGCKKICTYESLYILFKSADGYYDSNPEVDGVDTLQLVPFCRAIKTRMYALDDNDRVIFNYAPPTINKNLPPLVFKIKDNHFFAILDRSMSIARIGKRKTNMDYETAKDKQMKADAKNMKVVVLKHTEQTPTQQMVAIMKEKNIQVYPFKNIQFDKGGLRGFKLDDAFYMFDEDDCVTNAMKISALHNEPYTGGTIYTILIDLLNALNYTHKSVCNPNLYKLLTTEGVKWRTHYGLTDIHLSQDDIEEMVEKGDAICADISKCYTSCITDAYDEWLQYDFNCDFEDFDLDAHHKLEREHNTRIPLPQGLYYAITDDTTLLHGSNIYSNVILDLARKEGIECAIMSQCLPSSTLPKNYFHNLLEAIKKICKGDASLIKSLNNIITGFLGKHKTMKYYTKMNTDKDVVFDDFNKPEYQTNNTYMFRENEFYIYGYKQAMTNAECNIPMYIQVLDWSNIRLYNMIKESGGTCLFRKTDCAIIADGTLPFKTKEDAQPGDYRVSGVPKVGVEQNVQFRKCNMITVADDWDNIRSIRSSNQINDVFNLLMERKGICNVSRAGTGKTYNLLAVEKLFKEKFLNHKVIKLAFTNKACLQFKGTTIHKFLKIDKKGKINLRWLNTLKEFEVLVEIDEISMIGSFLWRRLAELKKALPNAYFILSGDYRQVPPVEEGRPFDYFNSAVVKHIANYTRIEFVERQRYDKPLWDFAENVYERGLTNYDQVKTMTNAEATAEQLSKYINICYYNATRKHINKIVNEWVAKSHTDVIHLPYVQKKDDKETTVVDVTKVLQQHAILYNDLPIIAHKNTHAKKSKDDISDTEDDEDTPEELLTVNNELFVITDMDYENFTATSHRTTDTGDEYKHSVTMPIKEFHETFLLNYCSTTHKQQGATINNDVCIFDYADMDKRLRYTAITRVKNINQITIINNLL